MEAMQKGIFRLYDIRGKVPSELDSKGAAEIGSALSKFFKSGTLILGFDARTTSPGLYKGLVAGLSRNKKLNFLEAGLMTTPMLYFLVNHFRAAGGVMVTASHDPKNINGFKVVKKKAVPVSGLDVLKLLP